MQKLKIFIASIIILTSIIFNVQAINYIESYRPNNDYCNKINIINRNSPIIWHKTYGGIGRDNCWSILKTDDNGFVLMGETTSYDNGGGDAWLVKLDEYGNELWNKSYGGNRADYGFDVVQNSDEGYTIAGGTRTYTKGDHDTWLVKTDYLGNEIWNNSYGGENRDQGYALMESSDGGFVICGGSGSYTPGPNDYWIIKTDNNGNEIWNKTYGNEGYDWGYDIIETKDGEYIFTGGTDTSIDHSHILDIGIISINKEGEIIWDESFNKPPAKNRWDEGYSIIETDDNNLLIGGIAHTYHWFKEGEGDGWIIKTDCNGNIIWDRIIGGDLCDGISTIKQANNGGFICSGWTYSYGNGDSDIWLLKLNKQGYVEWDLTIGDDDYEWSMLHTLEITEDKCYLIAGTTYSYGAGNSDMFIAKVQEPSIDIDFKGGLGFSFEIINNGDEDFYNLSWNINISNSVLFGLSSSGLINQLSKDETISVKNNNFIIGFGEGTIRFSIGDLGKTVHCLFIGPFVIKR
jgi:hypothetical protein